MSHIFGEALYPSRGPQGFCKGCTWMQVLSTADIARFVKVFQPAAFRSSPCFSIWSEETFSGGTHLDAHQTSKRCSTSAGRAPASVTATWISRPCWYLTAPCRQIAWEVIGTPIVWELWGPDRYLTSNLYWLSRPGSIALIDWNDINRAVSMRRQEKWHHLESISNSDLRFTEGKFPMIDTARKRGSSQFAGFSRHQEAGPTSGSTSSLFLRTLKDCGGKCASRSDPNIVFIIVILMTSITMSWCVCVS